MGLNRKKFASGRLDGTGATIIYTYQSKRERKRPHEKCKYYKEHCSNPKAARYLSPCYKTCSWWEDYASKRGGKKSNPPKTNNNTQAPELTPTKQNHTLCRYYETETGKCHNIKCGLDFPVCEGACIYWKRRSTITPPVCNPDKQEDINSSLQLFEQINIA